MTSPLKIERRPRKIVIACDGTWMNSDLGWAKASLRERLTKGVQGHPVDPSNVTRICRAMCPEDPHGHPQIVYYQNGIGSSWSVIDKFLGGGLALGLSDNIRAAYAFLVNNYMENDLIYFIGYSRGAFTARSTAGMVAKFGLLEKSAMRYFYEIFEDWEGAGEKGYEPKLPKSLREDGVLKTKGEYDVFIKGLPAADSKDGPDAYLDAYAQKLRALKMTREVKIAAIGVFDTVGSLGLPVSPWLQKLGLAPTLRKYRFYDTAISNNVLNAFQALALDEHRSAFSPTLWEKPEGNNTVLKQTWFPGVHSNIGGGAHDTGISDITLAWMMSHLATISSEDPKLNIAFNEKYLIGEVDANKAAYKKETPPRHWVWGLGDLINSYTLPANIIGKHIRTPGAYPKLRYDNGKPLASGELLVNTNEFLHASVRARMELGGKNYDLETQYFPQALGATKYDTVHTLKKKWTHPTGDHKHYTYQGTLLKEDQLGVFEKDILDEEDGKKLFGHGYKAPHGTLA